MQPHWSPCAGRCWGGSGLSPCAPSPGSMSILPGAHSPSGAPENFPGVSWAIPEPMSVAGFRPVPGKRHWLTLRSSIWLSLKPVPARGGAATQANLGSRAGSKEDISGQLDSETERGTSRKWASGVLAAPGQFSCAQQPRAVRPVWNPGVATSPPRPFLGASGVRPTSQELSLKETHPPEKAEGSHTWPLDGTGEEVHAPPATSPRGCWDPPPPTQPPHRPACLPQAQRPAASEVVRGALQVPDRSRVSPRWEAPIRRKTGPL